MKKILFASSEAVPFIKTGGLADVVGSLPKYFDRKKYDVRVILPKYLCMDKKWQKRLKKVADFKVQLGWRNQYAGILQTKADGIWYYFIDNEFYFAGDHPYGEIYQDVEKFAFFSKAVLEALDKINFIPDVLHCNDWQTGIKKYIRYFLYTIFAFRADGFYMKYKTLPDCRMNYLRCMGLKVTASRII